MPADCKWPNFISPLIYLENPKMPTRVQSVFSLFLDQSHLKLFPGQVAKHYLAESPLSFQKISQMYQGGVILPSLLEELRGSPNLEWSEETLTKSQMDSYKYQLGVSFTHQAESRA